MGKEIPLTDRAQRLLKALVEHHIREGRPVGSTTLSREPGLKVSSATIRNTMSDLGAMGLIAAPHVSAGRIPTQKGYRFFVDSLLTVQPLETAQVQQLESQVSADGKRPEEIFSSASSLLSEMTQMASVVMVPRREQVILRQLEFVALSEHEVLAILVTQGNEVQNRIIKTEQPFSESQLQQAANWFNAQFAGEDLALVRGRLLEELDRARQEVDQSMRAVVQAAAQPMFDQTLQGQDEDEVLVRGRTQLMNYEELGDVNHLRQLFETFSQKQSMLHLLDRCMDSDGVQIFIGEESGFETFDDCSVITAPYRVEDQVVGVLGVIGPTRMAYDRVIPLVDMTAKLLGSALNLAR